jgi:Proline-rich nuclear receptor coactivator motif
LLFLSLQRHTSSFKGDQDSHLNDLIVASQTKQIDNVVLKERRLVPFYDSHVAPAALQPLQGSKKKGISNQHQQHQHDNHHTNTGNKQRRTNSSKAAAVDDAGMASAIPKPPPRKNNKNSKTATAAKQANDANTQHQSRKHHRDPSSKHLPGLALPGGGTIPASASSAPVPATSGRQSPPRKRQEQNFFATASSMPAKFAGPAFTNSPMPDDLPIPTTSLLLMHEAADRMAQGLML